MLQDRAEKQDCPCIFADFGLGVIATHCCLWNSVKVVAKTPLSTKAARIKISSFSLVRLEYSSVILLLFTRSAILIYFPRSSLKSLSFSKIWRSSSRSPLSPSSSIRLPGSRASVDFKFSRMIHHNLPFSRFSKKLDL